MIMYVDIDKRPGIIYAFKKNCGPLQFGDQGPKSGPLKNCEGPQIFDFKGPNGPLKFLLILTPAL